MDPNPTDRDTSKSWLKVEMKPICNLITKDFFPSSHEILSKYTVLTH